MEYTLILRQAWQVTTTYRKLWVFGFLLALFGGNGSSGVNLFDLISSGLNPFSLSSLLDSNLALVIALVLLLAGWILSGFVIRAVSTTAILALEQHRLEKGLITLKTGWRFGWSSRAWRIFLIELIVRVTTSLVFLIALLIALAPLLLFFVDIELLWLLGSITTFGFACLWFLFFTVSSLFIAPFIEICRRYVILADIGTINSIKYSYHLLRQKARDFLGATMLMFALNLVWSFISSILFAILGGLTLISQITPMLSEDPVLESASTVAVTIVLGIAGLIGGLSWVFITGIFLVFQLTFWTTVFREINLTAY